MVSVDRSQGLKYSSAILYFSDGSFEMDEGGFLGRWIVYPLEDTALTRVPKVFCIFVF